ncbi:hypothetical protein DMC47_19980 [Nostoc sp. 3335mG]|nr:hypothetical protein DMC47_19980 [Nostoc sp. 3335mG]
MRFGMMAAVAAATLVAGQAGAQTAQKASFAVGGVAMEVTPPAGFCVPTGMAQAAAKMAEAADPNNATLASFYPCDKMSQARNTDYFLLKTIKTMTDVTFEREELLAALTAELTNPNFSADNLSKKAGEDSSKSVSDAVGTDVKVTTKILPLGRDADCAYMGGVVAAAFGADTVTLSVGACLTVVGGRMVMVYRYAPGTTMEQAKPLLPQVRNLAMAIRVKK